MPAAPTKEAIREFIRRSLDDLPSLPPIVSRVIAVCDDPQATADDLNAIILTDPAVAGKLLRVVNSAYYGMRAQVSNTQQAIMILGFPQVKNLVLSLGAFQILGMKASVSTEARTRIWKHSFATALASSLVADVEGLYQFDRDLAYIGGLLHDVGALFLLGTFPSFYQKLLVQAEEKGVELESIETELIGCSHAEVGAMVAEAWQFPDRLVKAIGSHESPTALTDDPAAACVIAGDYFAALAGAPMIFLDEYPMPPALQHWASSGKIDFTSLAAQVKSAVAETQELLMVA